MRRTVTTQELAGGEVADEIAVGGDEVVLGQVAQGAPADVLEDEVGDLAAVFLDQEELQVDGAAAAVVVADVGDARADGGVDVELFLELAAQRLLGGFAGLHLAAGEFPLGAERLVGTALTDQHLVAAQDQGGGDLPDCFAVVARSFRASFWASGAPSTLAAVDASVLCCFGHLIH